MPAYLGGTRKSVRCDVEITDEITSCGQTVGQ